MPSSRVLSVLALLSAALWVPGCAAPRAAGAPLPRAGADVRLVRLGEEIVTARGKVFVVRVQGEYRLIRCIPDGPIAGCYEDVLAVPGNEVAWNRWVPVPRLPGLSVAFVSPTDVAVRETPPPRPATAVSVPRAAGYEPGPGSPVMAR